MCGIIGYIGSKPVVPVLLDGLRRMEYRGYDSAGVALVSPEGIALRRSAGKLMNLENVLRDDPADGVYGVGHTRWATHGRPTEENAHPHRDCTGRIVVVHNGIIENYLELKHELQEQGHVFKTETDTEIVAHLVEREMRSDGFDNAVRRALGLMRGMFALVLVSVEDPEKIVAVRNGPPIIVGLGQDEFFVASDIPGDPQSHARRRLPWRRRDGRHHQVGSRVHRLRRASGVQDHQTGDVGSNRGRKGRTQALHAQGDLRAADGCPGHDPRPRLSRAGTHLPGGDQPLRGGLSEASANHHHRVRNVLACGSRRQVPHRDPGASSGRSRLRLRVSLPASPSSQQRRIDHRHHPVW